MADVSVRSYSDRHYQHVATVRHNGTILSLASDEHRDIYYSVLAPDDKADSTGWLLEPRLLPFPDEIAAAGYGVADQTRLPQYRTGSTVSVASDVVLGPDERDDWASTSARLSADAPFEVLSDGRYVYVFRRSIQTGAESDSDRLVWVSDDSGSQVLDASGAPVPVVDSELLADRYVLAGDTLQIPLEVRYQRSRSRTRPDSPKDGLGPADLEKRPFRQPTLRLPFLGKVRGSFSVFLTPTTVADVSRWNFALIDSRLASVDLVSCERSPDGLFSPRGTPSLGCPDHDDVFSLTPGTCPAESVAVAGTVCGRELLPIAHSGGHAGTAVEFTSGDVVTTEADTVPSPGRVFTMEVWLRPAEGDAPGRRAVVGSGDRTEHDAPSLWTDDGTGLIAGFGDGATWREIRVDNVLTAGTWHHVALTCDGTRQQLYVDGQIAAIGPAMRGADQATAYLPALSFGAAERGFLGAIDEVRLWSITRSGRDLLAGRSRRLTGSEPGLLAYWRFDEGAGTVIRDATPAAVRGTLNRDLWTTSSAPISESPGLQRSRVMMTGLRATGGIAATVYHRQEDLSAGYSATLKPAKAAARVLLTVSTEAGDTHTGRARLAVLDLSIAADGGMARLPGQISLPVIGSGDVDQLTAKDALHLLATGQESLRASGRRRDDCEVAARALGVTITYLDAVLRNGAAAAPAEVPPGLTALLANCADAAAALAVQQTRLRELDHVVASGIVSVHQHANFGGHYRHLTGVGNHDMHPHGYDFARTISSLVVPHGLEVVAWRARGVHQSFRGAVPYVGDGMNDSILYVDIRPDAEARAAVTQEVNAAIEAVAHADAALRDRKADAEHELADLRAEITALKDDQRSAAKDITRGRDALTGQVNLGMPVLAVDARGLTATGAQLDFASTPTEDAGGPTLLDGALGRVSLYFPGVGGELSVAHYSTAAERAHWSFATDDGAGLLLSARSSDLHSSIAGGSADTLTVTLSGEDSGTCSLLLQFTGLTGTVEERWAGLPVSAAELCDVLSGRARQPSAEDPAGLPGTKYDYDAKATSSVPGVDLTRGSRFVVARSGSAGALDLRRAPVASLPRRTPQWFGAIPGTALNLDATARLAQPTGAEPEKLRSGDGHLSVEAWVRADEPTGPGRIVSVSEGAATADDGSGYLLGVRPTGGVSMRLDGRSDWLELTGLQPPRGQETLTIEAWVRPENLDTYETIVGLSVVRGVEVTLAVEGGGYSFGWAAGGRGNTAAGPSRRGDAGSWVHIAGVYDGWDWRLYRNGVLEATMLRSEGNPVGFGGTWTAGASLQQPEAYEPGEPTVERLLRGSLDEVRVWGTARTPSELESMREVAVAADSPDLLGLWRFSRGTDGGPQVDGSAAVAHGSASCAASPLSRLDAYVRVDDTVAAFPAALRDSTWHHLALTYEQRHGVRVDNGGRLACGKNESLNLTGDLTLEFGVKLDDLSAPHGLISRGRPGFAEEDSPYDLSIDTAGRIVFGFHTAEHARARRFFAGTLATARAKGEGTFMNAGDVFRICRSEGTVTPGVFTRVAVTRKRVTDVQNSGEGAFTTASVTDAYDIRFYLDGRPAGEMRYVIDNVAPDVGSSVGETLLGQSWSPVSVTWSGMELAEPELRHAQLRGQLSEVRMWNVARAAGTIGVDIPRGQSNLVAWWRFPENRGNSTDSAVGGPLPAVMRGAVSWSATPDPDGSTLTMYCDGVPMTPHEYDGPPALIELGEPHVAVGGGGSEESGYLRGQLDELRIWRIVRTPEQITDNMFQRLTGGRDSLLMHHTFDPQPGGLLLDEGPQGLNLVASGDLVLSSAPVSEDAPHVANAVLQVGSHRTAHIDSAPAVDEYADLQILPDGSAAGVLKRCYATISRGRWDLVSGFRVGDLVTEWIGQAQFDPQLVGFIEGAPPVPSENLTLQDDYTDASSVALTEAASTTTSYSADRETGVDTSTEGSLLAGMAGENGIGLGYFTKIASFKNLAGSKSSTEFNQNWLDSASAAQERSLSRISTMSLRGRKEADLPLDAELGRRWVPENTGYALVQSETADVFALRVAHTGTVVSYSLQPNPDIPRDWNIITFPLNDHYTLQGSLDGKVGLAADPAYPQAMSRSSDSSYFKPLEAYALKNRIRREEERLATQYAQFAAAPRALRNSSSGDMASQDLAASLPSLAKRNLVNTYVWTADGGLFAEEEQAQETRTETIGGSYSFQGKTGFQVKSEFQFTLAAVEFEVSAMFGQHLNLTVTKSRESSTSFGAAVEVKPEHDLSGTYQGEEHRRRPGKVDAYRFMTFYLEPQSANFDLFFNSVVDPVWLAEDLSPAARALRETQQSDKRPPCWRVMHRVTYVSRVLPELSASSTGIEAAIRELDLDSNHEVLQALDPYVRDKASSYPIFAQAVREAVAARLPALQPHLRSILEFLVLYYGVPDAPAVTNVSDAVAALNGPIAAVQLASEFTTSPGAKVELSGSVLDEELALEAFSVRWTVVSGPGPVVLEAERSTTSAAHFPEPGVYALRLTASAPGRTPVYADTSVVVVPEQVRRRADKPMPVVAPVSEPIGR